MCTIYQQTTKNRTLQAYHSYLQGAADEDLISSHGISRDHIAEIKRFHDKMSSGGSYSSAVKNSRGLDKRTLQRMLLLYSTYPNGNCNHILQPDVQVHAATALQHIIHGTTKKRLLAMGYSSRDVEIATQYLKLRRCGDVLHSTVAERLGVKLSTARELAKVYRTYN